MHEPVLRSVWEEFVHHLRNEDKRPAIASDLQLLKKPFPMQSPPAALMEGTT